MNYEYYDPEDPKNQTPPDKPKSNRLGGHWSVHWVWDDNRDESQFLTNQERDDWDDWEPNSWGY